MTNIQEQYEGKVLAVARSLISLNLDFINDMDQQVFIADFKQLIGIGLKNQHFRQLTEALLHAAGESITLSSPQQFFEDLKDYLTDTGYYYPMDNFIKAGRIRLNSVETNIHFFGFPFHHISIYLYLYFNSLFALLRVFNQ